MSGQWTVSILDSVRKKKTRDLFGTRSVSAEDSVPEKLKTVRGRFHALGASSRREYFEIPVLICVSSCGFRPGWVLRKLRRRQISSCFGSSTVGCDHDW